MRSNRSSYTGIGWKTTTILALLLGLVFGLAAVADEAAGDGAKPPGTLEFVGHNLFGDADGIFRDWHIVERSIDPANLAESSALIEVDLASLDTGNGRRDDHLRNPDFFEVETFPTARVRVHSPRPAGTTDAGEPRFKAKFDIDLHGVQKTVEGEIRKVGEDPLRFEGGLVLDRTDFGVGAPPSRWNPMSVAAEIPISFRVEL